jgi:hypothetical protein
MQMLILAAARIPPGEHRRRDGLLHRRSLWAVLHPFSAHLRTARRSTPISLAT